MADGTALFAFLGGRSTPTIVTGDRTTRGEGSIILHQQLREYEALCETSKTRILNAMFRLMTKRIAKA
jgi:hypothetical protein